MTTIQQKKINPQTPLGKLLSDKRRLRRESALQEQKLSEDFSYIQENAGSLLISGVTTLLFPHNKDKKSEETVPATTSENKNTILPSLGISDYLGIAQGALPLVWDVARPFLITWGIRKAQSWLTHRLFKKKK